MGDEEQVVRKRVRPTPQLYNALLDFYRDNGAMFGPAAEHTSTNRTFCKRAWEEGFVEELGEFALPIKSVLQNETILVRAKLQEEEERNMALIRTQQQSEYELAKQQQRIKDETDREKARIQAINTKVEEAKSVKLARRSANSLLKVMEKLHQGAADLAEKTIAALAETDVINSSSAGDGQIRITTAIRIIESISKMTRETNESARIALEMERIRVGEPTESITVRHEVSMSDAVDTMERANRAVERAKKMGIIPSATIVDPVVAVKQIEESDAVLEDKNGVDFDESDDYSKTEAVVVASGEAPK